MSNQRFDAARPAPADRQLLSTILEGLWPVDGESRFGGLLRAIDEAIFRQQCHSRLARFHRMLERQR